jgi:RND family efflux transporter MFP subunit
MHPEVRSNQPGECPECGMQLQPVAPEPAADDSIAFYTCTMHPSVHVSEPGRCPICNMDLIPVMKKPAADSGASADLSFHVSLARQQMVGVTFATVERRNLQKVVTAYGRVDYDETALAVVNLRVAGWIEKLFVDFTGQFVRKGDPLFRLYSPALVSAQSEYLLALASPDTTAEYARSLVDTARERLRLWQITDQQLRELERTRQPLVNIPILSPVSGYVVEKMAVEGMRIEPDMALYRIADLSTVWLQADVYESELPFVRVGQAARITLPSLTGRELHGTVSYVDPVLDPTTRAARVRIVLPNDEGLFKPDMYASVELQVDLGERLVVPDGAVLRTGERQIAFVDQGDGIFEMRLVTLGARAKGYYEILAGLAPGERVVASANFLIDAESRVQGVLRRLDNDSTTVSTPAHRH